MPPASRAPSEWSRVGPRPRPETRPSSPPSPSHLTVKAAFSCPSSSTSRFPESPTRTARSSLFAQPTGCARTPMPHAATSRSRSPQTARPSPTRLALAPDRARKLASLRTEAVDQAAHVLEPCTQLSVSHLYGQHRVL